MLGITNLKPIESINSVLKPLRLKVSNKEQMISKLALVTLASLTIYSMLSKVEGLDQNQRRLIVERICNRESQAISRCKDSCMNRFENAHDRTNAIRNCFAWCMDTHGRTHLYNHS